MKKDKIIYVYDPLCIWCHGFESIMQEFYNNQKANYDFQIISAGFFSGDSIQPLRNKFPEDFRAAFEHISNTCSVEISEKFLGGLLEKENFIANSEKPATAFSAFKTYPISKDNELEFIARVQKLIFIEGVNPNKDDLYKKVAQSFSINPEEFIEKINNPEIIAKAFEDFKLKKDLKVTTFPQVMLQKDNKTYIISKGFVNLDTLENNLKEIKSQLN